MASLRTRVEEWIRDQTAWMGASWPSPPPLPQLPALPLPQWHWWPPWNGRGDRRAQERAIQEEYERRQRQVGELCRAVKADSVAELQEILSSMVLSECVYKRPAADMIRYINKFKSDFGGQIVSLERVQPSLDHVSHRYLLAEADDTIYASFIGTKQYKDVIADANIFQGAIFHEDSAEGFDANDVESEQADREKKLDETLVKSLKQKRKQMKGNSKPAAHRGFLARAKGIPALELYKLAQKKNRKLVLCGHSLGGAVAVLSTLAILRVLASSPMVNDKEKVQVKCITFSQPPVGNAALRDYVHQKGWQQYFKTYCIPEDLVPRILSPAYFHHYNAQVPQPSSSMGQTSVPIMEENDSRRSISIEQSKRNDGKQLVLGVGPVQTSFWRLSKLVPLDGVRKHLSKLKDLGINAKVSSVAENTLLSAINEMDTEPQSLEIQEGTNGISLTPLRDIDRGSVEANNSQIDGKSGAEVGESRLWHRVPYLPSYVPFGQLYILGSSSVESLPDMEYSKLTSVRSVITELKELFQSHSMKSYRSRFQKIYDMCMCVNASSFLGLDQMPQLPHLQQWLGLAAAGSVELAHIMEPPVIRTATSILPLGWNGIPGEKNSEPLKVDILGHGLHLCTFVQAQVNGNWCSTTVDSISPVPPYTTNKEMQNELQQMRILIGRPLKQPPKSPFVEDPLLPVFPSAATECESSVLNYKTGHFFAEEKVCTNDSNDFFIYLTSDFLTACKKVHIRTRRVRLLGLEGAGKTSLIRALFTQNRQRSGEHPETAHFDVDGGVSGGLFYSDSAGVNLQKLQLEISHFKDELQVGAYDLSKKTDLVVLVHNLSHKVTWQHESINSQPALSLFLNEVKALGIPWVLAITNKFSVSAHQQKALINSVMEAYKASPDMTEVVNSCPFVIPTASNDLQSLSSVDEKLTKEAVKKFRFSPIDLAWISFRKKEVVMPIEGVSAFRQLVHRVLVSHEEIACEELANKTLSLKLAREQEKSAALKQESQGTGSSLTAAAVGASLGAGLGLVMAVVMGAASALRKP